MPQLTKSPIALPAETCTATALIRLGLPMAYSDPAFMACLDEAAKAPELVENFDRLARFNLCRKGHPINCAVDDATGRTQEAAASFVRFVHDGIYLRLPDEAIDALRLSALIRLPQIRG